MALQGPQATDNEVLSLVKQISGKLIERRRRRDGVSQVRLAQVVARSDRWLREIEAGIATSILDDHVRCAHALDMTTPHLFIPLLAAEHRFPIPRELLLQDDLWDLERDILGLVADRQAAVVERLVVRSVMPDSGRPNSCGT